jgi:hypothetical protein
MIVNPATTGNEGFAMNDLVRVSQEIHNVKSLAIGISRAIRKITQAQNRGTEASADVVKAMATDLRAMISHETYSGFIAGRFTDAEIARLMAAKDNPSGVIKASTSPAMTTVAGWAVELTGGVSVAPILELSPNSAFSQLAARPSVLKLDLTTGSMRLPNVSSGDLAGDFVGEASAIRVNKTALTSTGIAPAKIGLITTFSRELARHSSFEEVIRSVISTDVWKTVDLNMFSANAGTAIKPPGLLYGVAAIAPSAAAGAAAVAADLAALAGAILYPLDMLFLSNPATHLRALLLCPGAANIPWVESPFIPDRQIIGLDAGSLAVAGGSMEFDSTEQGAVVLSDSTVVEPFASMQTDSMFQMALIGLRLLLDISWGLRAPGRLSHVDAIGW